MSNSQLHFLNDVGSRMTEQELYENMPHDPELAFIYCERFYREQCESKIKAAHPEGDIGHFWAEYMGRVVAAIKELGLETNFAQDRLPKVEDINYQTYLNFGQDVESFRTTLLIRNGRRTQGFSVRFDEASKLQLRHHLERMRELVGKLEVEDKKREALFNKINALQQEVDRDRTRFDALADLTIEASGVADAALEPVNRILNSIAKVFWGAKDEEIKRLPPPKRPKQLEDKREVSDFGAARPEPQKTDDRTPTKRGDLDDEIPF